jgi:hypothetical protein
MGRMMQFYTKMNSLDLLISMLVNHVLVVGLIFFVYYYVPWRQSVWM